MANGDVGLEAPCDDSAPEIAADPQTVASFASGMNSIDGLSGLVVSFS